MNVATLASPIPTAYATFPALEDPEGAVRLHTSHFTTSVQELAAVEAVSVSRVQSHSPPCYVAFPASPIATTYAIQTPEIEQNDSVGLENGRLKLWTSQSDLLLTPILTEWIQCCLAYSTYLPSELEVS